MSGQGKQDLMGKLSEQPCPLPFHKRPLKLSHKKIQQAFPNNFFQL